ncbi:MAG TPA: prenyltransferase/squalene oxidase repeat-containing protein [Planctomycetota bacterium]|nr:prenyltransferase/squalene oxidase repeat-containing protein [Planctomycetota bacterium]
MRRFPGWPFLLSAAVSAPLGFAALRWSDARGGESRSPAYFDYHLDVAHDGSALDSSLRFALQWLHRHQHAEGMWSARSFGQLCEGDGCSGVGADEHDVGVTALAVLAILEAGPARDRHVDAAKKGLGWLAEQQGLDGGVGPSSGKFMYGHAMAALAFARSCRVLASDDYRPHALKAARFLRQARNPGYAWRYGVRDGENDTSVTAWAGAALLACSTPEVGAAVDARVWDGIRRSLAQSTRDWTQETFYRRSGATSTEDRFERNEGLTAMALWLRLKMGADAGAPELRASARRLGWCLPVWNESGASVDYVAWFAGTRALEAYGDAALWDAWSAPVRRLLVSRQKKYVDGCSCGSWDPVDRWGSEGGRVYATAMNALTLGILSNK